MMEQQLSAVLVVPTAVVEQVVDKAEADPIVVDSSVVVVVVVVVEDLAAPMVVDPAVDKEAVVQAVLPAAGTAASCAVELDQTAHPQPAVVPAYPAHL